MKTQICKLKDFTGKIKYYLSIEDFAERRCTLIISEKEYNKLFQLSGLEKSEIGDFNNVFNNYEKEVK